MHNPSLFYIPGIFLTMVMTLNSISLIIATLVINVKKKGERKPPPIMPRWFLRFCVIYLARVTCTRPITTTDYIYPKCRGEEELKHNPDVVNMPGVSSDGEFLPDYDSATTYTSSDSLQQLSPMRDSDGTFEEFEMESLNSGSITRQMTRRRRRKKRSSYVIKWPKDFRHEWYFVAEIIDKLLFFVYTTGLTLTVLIILIIIPALVDVNYE